MRSEFSEPHYRRASLTPLIEQLDKEGQAAAGQLATASNNNQASRTAGKRRLRLYAACGNNSRDIETGWAGYHPGFTHCIAHLWFFQGFYRNRKAVQDPEGRARQSRSSTAVSFVRGLLLAGYRGRRPCSCPSSFVVPSVSALAANAVQPWRSVGLVQRLVNALIDVMQTAGQPMFQGRQTVAQALNGVFDVLEMTRIAVGPMWNDALPIRKPIWSRSSPYW